MRNCVSEVTAHRYGVPMAGTGLEVRLHQGRHRAELSQFTRTLNEIRLSLRDIDEVYLLQGTRATWVVDDLKHEHNDLVVRLQARNVPSKRPLADMEVPVEALVDGAVALQQQPAVPAYFTPTTVNRLAKLATPTVGIQGVSLASYNGVVGPRVELDDAVRDNAAAAANPIAMSWGSVTGRLSELKTPERSGGVRVTIRDDARQAIAGHVPQDRTEQLREMWGHRVTLGGVLKRNASGQVVHIDVDRLEPMPDNNSERVSADKLLGISAGSWTDKQIEEFLHDIRRPRG
jgi:hypothetical protein